MRKLELVVALVTAMFVTGIAHSEVITRGICETCNGSGITNLSHPCGHCDGGDVRCPNCRGEGEYTCGQCGGSGTVTVYGEVQTCNLCDGDGTEDCGMCHGAGSYSCSFCGGSGEI